MKRVFLDQQFPVERFEQFTIKTGNRNFSVHIDSCARVFGIPLRKMGFRVGDTLVMKIVAKNQIIMEKLATKTQIQ